MADPNASSGGPSESPRPASPGNGRNTANRSGQSRGGKGRSGQGNRSRGGQNARGQGGGSGGRSSSGQGNDGRNSGRSNGGRGNGRPGGNQRNQRPGGAQRAKPTDSQPVIEQPAVAVVEAPRTLGTISAHEVSANRRRAWTLCLSAAVLPALVVGVVLGLAVGVVVGVVTSVVAAVLVAVGVDRRATSVALRAVGARPARHDEVPGLENVMDGLCATFGLRMPAVMLVDDPVPNACALGRGPADAVLVVTTGLVARLDLIEMEGVVAQQLAHVKRGDALLSSVAVTVVGPWGRLTGNDRLLHRALGPGREYRADQVAAAVVRYPPGLYDAMVAMVAAPPPAPSSIFAGQRGRTRWIWIDPMAGHREEPLADGDLDGTAVRIAALAEL